MQAAISTEAHLEDISTPLCNPFDHSCGGVADRGGSAEPQEPLDLWATQMESMPAGISDAVPLDVRHSSGDVSIAAQDSPLHDSASLALWEAFRGEVSISASATDHPTSPSRILETDGPNLPLHTAGLSPGGPNIDMAPSNKSSLEEGDRVQQPQLIDDRERNNASLAVLESSLVEQEDTSRAACDMSAHTAPSDSSTCDRAHSSRSADIIDAADIESSDGDGPPLTHRRRRTGPHNRDSSSPSSLLIPWSSVHSMEVESTAALLRRKRLQQRKGMRRDSVTPETDDASTSLTTSISGEGRGERWPIQCFVERKMIGSQEVTMIQVPAFDLCARSGRLSTLSPLDDTSQTTPILGAACEGRRRARFSRAEEDLLVKLKEQRGPKLSWREIQRRFQNRTTGSLQVHYSTHLKGRGLSERRACRRS